VLFTRSLPNFPPEIFLVLMVILATESTPGP
jgi:hypothetical protein